MKKYEIISELKKRHDTLVYMELFGCCTDHTGKMTGLNSFSTSVCCNELCQKKRNIPGSICEHCFSASMHELREALSLKTARNTELITECIIPVEHFPIITKKNAENGFRFEAFGDLNNEIQVVNYFTWCSVIDGNCALWTKNPWIIERAMKKYGIKKPANLTIIGSSYFVNKPMSDYYKRFNFIDHVFTVYTPEYARENNVFISCGARSCASCQKCYKKGLWNHYEINELLK